MSNVSIADFEQVNVSGETCYSIRFVVNIYSTCIARTYIKVIIFYLIVLIKYDLILLKPFAFYVHKTNYHTGLQVFCFAIAIVDFIPFLASSQQYFYYTLE